MTSIDTARQHLEHIADNWDQLRQMLEARTPRSWPPAGRMADYQRDLEDDDTATAHHQAAALERAERTALAPGQRPAPLRVSILDTVTDLEAELNALADQVADAVQRRLFSVRSAHPGDRIARDMAMMAARDYADPRRWHYSRRPVDGPTAARWILDRLAGSSGPHRALTEREAQHVAQVAREIRRRLDCALGDLSQAGRVQTGLTCACGGPLEVLNQKDDFAVKCGGCGTEWSGTAIIEALNAA